MFGDPGQLAFDDRVRVTKPGTTAGTQDPVTGVWTGPPDALLYDGAADVQDTGPALVRGAGGVLREDWDARAWLPPEAEASGVVGRIPPHAAVRVTFADGTQATCEVLRTRRIDASLDLSRLLPVG